MKRTITILLLLLSPFIAFAQISASKEMPLSGNAIVLGSAAAADGHLYVLTGPKSDYDSYGRKSKDKTMLLHFDPTMNLVLQKPFRKPQFGKGDFVVIGMSVVGNQLIIMGKSENSGMNANSCEVGYVTIDKSTLLTKGKTSKIAEHTFVWSFAPGMNSSYEFKQERAGASLLIRISYYSSESAGSTKRTLKQHMRYLVLDSLMKVHDCFTIDRSGEKVNSQDVCYFINAIGNVYVAVREQDDVELSDNWWEDEAQRRKYAHADRELKIFSYSTLTGKVTQSQWKMEDESMEPATAFFFQGKDGVYLGGVLSDEQFRFRKTLEYDTTGMPELPYFCLFTTKVNIDKGTLTDAADVVRIDDASRQKHFANSTVTKEDREIGAADGIVFSGGMQLNDGQFVFTGGAFTDYELPPFEEIKDDQRYSFTKNAEGEITGWSAPARDEMRKYHHLFNVVFNPETNQLSMESIAVGFEINDDAKKSNLVVPAFEAVPDSGKFKLCFGETLDHKNGRNIYFWNGSGEKDKIDFTHDGTAGINSSASIGCNGMYTIVQGEKKFYILRLR